MTAPAANKTRLTFQYDGKLTKLATKLHSIRQLAEVEEANRQIFKQASDEDYVIVTEETIFHPQGGGQPSDEGFIQLVRDQSTNGESNGEGHASASNDASAFKVKAVRMDVINDGQVLHLGNFTDSSSAASLRAGDTVEQSIDEKKRLLYSRLHTAGHVLGSAVRSLLENEIPGFDELKASHFPDSAACEFQGAIEGKWKEPIQTRVNEYLDRKMPVEIDFWTEDDFKREGLERLIPDRRLLPPGEDRFRVVRIVGAEVYPCGGTHVDTTDLCGDTIVKKIARSKGVSRVSYTVA